MASRGEIALMSPKPDNAKAEEYFDRTLEVARKQQAKPWEAFDTLDLKEAKALLDELAS